MPKLIDWSGKIFSEWTVLERDSSKGCPVNWICKCSCGTVRSIPRSNLSSGKTTNCGCLQKEKTRIRMSKHGESKTKLYGVWLAMRRRCYLKTCADYTNWGGRGIQVCEDWKSSYESFKYWSINNGYKEGLTIERIEIDGNYEPSNCKWATRLEQGSNKQNTVYMTIDGIRKSVIDWSEEYGINKGTFMSRIKYGWSGKEILIPSKGRGANGTNARKLL